MPKRILTVSREFGSGGRAVGMQVADRLGIAYYDKEFIAKIAAQSGLDPAYIQKYGEYATSTSAFLYNLDLHGGLLGGELPIPDQLYVMQNNLLVDLAEKEPCVIVGRCADYALAGRDDCLHLFLHADKTFRAERIVHLDGETGADPVKQLKEVDDKRKVYYEYYTGRVWSFARNYHICLDSGAIGIDGCVETVVNLMKR